MQLVRGKRLRLALVGALLVGATVGLAAAPTAQTANSGTFGCGDTVTASFTLDKNLHCTDDGLLVGADGITINLNGFTISGTGAGVGVQSIGHTGDVVRDGTISGFDISVGLVSGADGNTVRNVRTFGSSYGIQVASSNNDVLNSNDADSNGVDGIVIGSSVGTQLKNNTALSNGGAGIVVQEGSTGAVSDNVTNGNSGDGIVVGPGSPVTLTNNRASFNSQLGINAAPDDNDGGSNVVQDNGDVHQCANVVCVEVSS